MSKGIHRQKNGVCSVESHRMNSVNCKKLFIRLTVPTNHAKKSEMLKCLGLGALAFVWYYSTFFLKKILDVPDIDFTDLVTYLDKLWASEFQKCGISLCSTRTSHECLPSPRRSIQKNTFGGTNTQFLKSVLVCHWQHYCFHKLLNLCYNRTSYYRLECTNSAIVSL
jgi:hypothetical protein